MLKLFFRVTFLFWFLLFISSSPTLLIKDAFADNPTESKEMQGFTDTELDESELFPEIDSDFPATIETENKTPNSASNFSLGGFLKLETEYGYKREHKELSKVKTTVFIESDYKINDQWRFKGSGNAFYDFAYTIESKNEFLEETLDDNEYNYSLKELYIDGRLSSRYSLKAGRQTVVFGESDYARILDVINPRDLTQPGLISIEDARMPVNIVRVSAFFDKWAYDVASIHENPGSFIVGEGSDFDYYASIRNPGISILDEINPKNGFKSPGVAAKTTRSFNGGDISFVAANTYDDQPYLSIKDVSASGVIFKPEYDKYRTYGVSGNIVKGSGLFKFETAFQQDIKLMRNDILNKINSGIPYTEIKTTRESDRLALMTGLEYSGITDLRINFEAELTHILDYESFLSDRKNEYRTYLQANYEMMNDALEFEMLWVHFHPDKGDILRLSANYDIFDGLNIEAGVAFYQSNDESCAIYPYKDQDRVFLRVKYSF